MKKLLLLVLPVLCSACSYVFDQVPQCAKTCETNMTWSQTSPLVFQKLSGDAYQVAIPELKFNLCLSSEGQKGDLDPAELTGEVRGNEVFLGKNNQIHYILKAKDPKISIQKQLEKDYELWSLEEYSYPWAARFKGQAFCVFSQNNTVKSEYEKNNMIYPKFWAQQEWSFWTLRTPYAIGVELQEEGEEYWGYDQTCWSKFPAQDLSGGLYVPYIVLYSWDFPDRYLLLNPTASKKKENSRYWYPKFEFLK